MAAVTMSGSFKVQIQALTGISISSTTEVTETDINNFLSQGLRDVVGNVAKYKPQDLHQFADSTTGAITSTGRAVSSGIVVNIWRADGVSATNLNQCTQINAALKHRAADVDSLHYRGKANPCYYWENDMVFILPAPSGTGIDRAIISEVIYDALTYNDTTVSQLGEQYYPLVALYAAIKQLEAYMAFYTVTEEDVELAAGLQANIATLKQQYQSAFLTVTPQGQQQ